VADLAEKRAAAVRVLVVDDHPIVRQGVMQTLGHEPGLDLCCEASSGAEAIRLTQEGAPDLAIVDLSLGDMHGLELVRRLHQLKPDLRILVLSMHDEMLFARRALQAGARGYITKGEAIGGLIGAFREVLAGRIYVSETVAQGLFEEVGRDAGAGAESRLAGLTNRELQVLELVGRGRSTNQIAGDLGVSVKTIETYRGNIRLKLGLSDANALVRFAVTWTSQL